MESVADWSEEPARESGMNPTKESARESAMENAAGWRASLALGFERRDGKTVLATRCHHGPLVVQKPFYPEARDTCHVYIVHPPGGVAGGDALEVDLHLARDARALITTPGAAKMYRSAGLTARLAQRFRVESGAVLEWMPQETIVHSGAQATMETEIDLDAGAHFAGWEIVCLGLPASGKPFDAGSFRQGMRLSRGGEPLFLDRCRFEGGGAMLDAPWGLGGNTVCGVFLATLGPDAEGMATPFPGVPGRSCFGRVDGLLVGRYIGSDPWEAKKVFIGAWARWRESVLQTPPCPPRIWNT